MQRSILTKTIGLTPVIDALVSEVGLVPAAVYGVVWRYCRASDGICTASQETIAEHLGLTRQTVNAALAELCKARCLEDVTQGECPGGPRTYRDTGRAKIFGRVDVQVASEQDAMESGTHPQDD